MPPDFGTEWEKVRRQVWTYCRRAAGSPEEGDDVFQEVAVRAWRGFSSFRGESPFIAWVMLITRNEVLRHQARRSRLRAVESSLEAAETDAVIASQMGTQQTQDAGAGGWLREALLKAAHASVLTEVELNVVAARLARPDSGWKEVGEALGMDGSTCAVVHCRALPKLRVFLFTCMPQMLGGVSVIKNAFVAASVDSSSQLTKAEATAFRNAVLLGDEKDRWVGSRSALRSACEKVIKHLPSP